MGKLTAIKVRTAKPERGDDGKVKAKRLSDGAGLQLLVKPNGSKSWVLRIQVNGRSRDIGLGSVDVDGIRAEVFDGDDPLAGVSFMKRTHLTLSEAREKSAALRKLAKAGADPVVERDRERTEVPTFAKMVAEAHEALADGWSVKTAKAFKASLAEHAVPKLGAMKVDAISASDIVLTLAPIWNDKPVMARKIRSRIGQVLAFAKARGWRAEALPDTREMKSGLSKQVSGGHFEAMPYAEIPAFVVGELGKELGSSRAAMLFAILTASRSGAVRKATWEQIDLDTHEWHCPAEIMKKTRSHDVALSSAAIAMLERLAPKGMRKGLLFPGARGGPLSDMSLTKSLRQAGRTETLHGFRSSFRDFAAERMPHTPFMVAQMALSHAVGNATDRAYLRTDMLEMRRTLMEAWGQFAAPSLSSAASNVVQLQRVSGG